MDENPDFDEFGLEYSCEIGGMFDDEVLDDVGDDFDEEVGEVSEDVREDVGTAKDGELLFMSFEAVDAALGNAFLGGGQEEANKIFKSLPYPLLKKVIGKAFQQNPWCGSERLVYITEDGVSVPISYLFFYRNVGGRFLARAYHAAKSAQVATYRGACEFMQLSTRKFGSEGGFNLVKRWLPRLVRESFAEKPFVPLHQMMLYRNGVPLRKITSFLAHKFCTDELQAKLVDVYEEAERDYLAESIDHVLEYMAEVKNFQWSKVPMYYHQVLLEMAFEDAPFKGGQHLKLDRPGGDRIGSLYYYYYLNSRKKLKKDDPPNGLMDFFNAMYNEVFEDYLSDINKVLDFIFSPEFREKGKGWNMVPEKWHKVFITNAVFQSDEENPRRTNLVCKYEGKGVLLLKILYARYMKNGRGAEFKSIYDDAVEMKKRMKAEMAESGEVKDSRFVAKNRKNKDGEGVVGVERDLKKKKRDRKLAVATNLSMSAEERIAGELYPRLPDEEILRNLMREAQGDEEPLRRKARVELTLCSRKCAAFFARAYVADNFLTAEYIQDSAEHVFSKVIDAYDESKGSVTHFLFARVRFFLLNRHLPHLNHNDFESTIRTAVNLRGRFNTGLKKRGLQARSFVSADPVFAAEVIGKGCRVSTVVINQSILKVNCGLNDEVQKGPKSSSSDGGGRELGDCLPSQTIGARVGEALLAKERSDLIGKACKGLKERELLIVRRKYGLKGGDLSADTVMEGLNTENEAELVDVVARFVSSIWEALIAKNNLPKKTANYFEGLIEKCGSYEKVLRKENQLGQFLGGHGDQELADFLAGLMGAFSVREQVILMELFYITPPAEGVLHMDVLGTEVFGVSRERVRQIWVKARDKMKAVLGDDIDKEFFKDDDDFVPREIYVLGGSKAKKSRKKTPSRVAEGL